MLRHQDNTSERSLVSASVLVQVQPGAVALFLLSTITLPPVAMSTFKCEISREGGATESFSSARETSFECRLR